MFKVVTLSVFQYKQIPSRADFEQFPLQTDTIPYTQGCQKQQKNLMFITEENPFPGLVWHSELLQHLQCQLHFHPAPS